MKSELHSDGYSPLGDSDGRYTPIFTPDSVPTHTSICELADVQVYFVKNEPCHKGFHPYPPEGIYSGADWVRHHQRIEAESRRTSDIHKSAIIRNIERNEFRYMGEFGISEDAENYVKALMERSPNDEIIIVNPHDIDDLCYSIHQVYQRRVVTIGLFR